LQTSLAATGGAAPSHRASLGHDAAAMSRSAVAALVLLVAGTILMVAQP
jgi:hypothetical protein